MQIPLKVFVLSASVDCVLESSVTVIPEPLVNLRYFLWVFSPIHLSSLLLR
jgi:hypothetical protein